jgi:hypothetical protein
VSWQGNQLSMMNGTDRKEIAARLRGLLAGQDDGNLAATARRLGVEEVSLRMSIDEDSPFPTIDVLAAVIGEYGIDPSYLLTGRYDGATHRKVLAGNATVAAEAIRELAAEQSGRPVVSHPTEPPRLHIA